MTLDEALKLQKTVRISGWGHLQSDINQYCVGFYNEIIRIEAKYKFNFDNSWTYSYLQVVRKAKLDESKFEIKMPYFDKEIFIIQYWKSDRRWGMEHTVKTFENEMLRAYDEGKLEEYLVNKHKNLFEEQKNKACKEILEQIDYIKGKWFGEDSTELFSKLDEVSNIINDLKQ